ncbi:hypothetical protein [Streptomyces sp. NPDC088727]|uniref:hypothetical protein n=1 Tax=Streptomyces sp. NPDC088727 TaxID=3365875 RepID=UPI0038001E96
MSTDRCGTPHPERPDIECDRPVHDMVGFHRNRETGTVWPGDAAPEPAPTGRGALASMAVRTTRAGRTGAPADAVTHWVAVTEKSIPTAERRR